MEPGNVNLNMMHWISSVGAKAPRRQIFKMQSDTMLVSPSPTCNTRKPVWKYDDPSSDESILNEINPCLVSLKELTVATQSHNKEVYPARRTFINTDRHKRLHHCGTPSIVVNSHCGPLPLPKEVYIGNSHHGTPSIVVNPHCGPLQLPKEVCMANTIVVRR